MIDNQKQTSEHSPDNPYKNRLDGILSAPLTPETIDTFADDALSQVVDLVVDATAGYDADHPIDLFKTSKDKEDAVFNEVNVGDVNTVLDAVSAVADRIHAIDGIIAAAAKSSTVILPPSLRPGPVPSRGTEVIEPKRHIPRLKTTLFIIQERFGIDISPESDMFHLEEGALQNGQMRQLPYYLLDMPTLERTMLVCDEEDNVTFVMDRSKLAHYDVQPSELISLTKADIDDLLAGDPTIGSRIVYSPKSFAARIEAALGEPVVATNSSELPPLEVGDFLEGPVPPVPSDDYMFGHAICKLYGISNKPFTNAVEALGLETEQYRSPSGHTRRYYSPEAIAQLHEYFIEHGLLTQDPPEGSMSVGLMSAEWGLSLAGMRQVVIALGLEGVRYRVNKKSTQYYDAEQVGLVREYLESKGHIGQRPPEGYMTLTALAAQHGHPTEARVKTAIRKLGIETIDYRGYSRQAKHVSPADVDRINEYLSLPERHADVVPDNAMTIPALVAETGASDATIRTAITRLGIEPMVLANEWGATRHYLTSDDVDAIRADVVPLIEREASLLSLGYVNRLDVARSLGVSSGRIASVGDALGIEPEKVRQAVMYSPESIEAIRVYINDHDAGAEPLPAGNDWLLQTGMAEALGTTLTTLKSILLNTTIEGTRYRNARGKVNTYYSPQDVADVRRAMKEAGLLADIAPDGYTSVQVLSDTLNSDRATLLKIMTELGVEGHMYRSAKGGISCLHVSKLEAAQVRNELERRRAERERKTGSAVLRAVE